MAPVRHISSPARLAGLLLAASALAQQEPPRGGNPVWTEAGPARNPANRARVAQQLRAQADQRKADAVKRIERLPLPRRQVRRDHAVRELAGWGEDGKPLYFTTRNANAAISTGSDQLRSSPYGATGAGWTLGVWDGGSVLASHQEFGGRVTVMDGAAADIHATHVGGTLAAAGVRPDAIGMAPAAQIDSYDWNDDAGEMYARGASYGGEPGMIYLSNHSYGYVAGWHYTDADPLWEWYGADTNAAAVEDNFGQYNGIASDTDWIADALPYYLSVWAAGNERTDNPWTGASVALTPGGPAATYDPARHPPGDGAFRNGYDTVSFNAVAKNVLTVGAVADAMTSGLRDPAKAVMLSFSSWGPTDDGRIKPDLVANGEALTSASADGPDQYTPMSGTSMASPNAAGTAQQILAYYAACFPGHYLRASSLKGLLIHTADDLGNPGPDYRFGWGLLNGQAAADLIADAAARPDALRLLEQELSPGATGRFHPFRWDGVSPIRATLCWTDPAAAPTNGLDSRAPMLVHDLDLCLLAPDNSRHLPWVMPFVGTWTEATLSAPAITGTNRTDNVEQVQIPLPPAPGVYYALITVNGTLSRAQTYSLCVSGSDPIQPPESSLQQGTLILVQ